MIVKGRNGEIEFDGRTVMVRPKKRWLSPSVETRMPIGRIEQVSYKAPGLMPGHLHFGASGTMTDPFWDASNGKGGVLFDKAAEPAFIALRDAVEEAIASR